MPIYELDGQAPEFPTDGQYYIADTAVVIGRVRLRDETPASGAARCCAATMSGSSSASARRSRTIARCTPIRAFR